jgi:hypothetical protein
VPSPRQQLEEIEEGHGLCTDEVEVDKEEWGLRKEKGEMDTIGGKKVDGQLTASV